MIDAAASSDNNYRGGWGEVGVGGRRTFGSLADPVGVPVKPKARSAADAAGA